MKKILILTGEGIECEKEAFRFFGIEELALKPEYCPIPKLLRKEIKLEEKLSSGDWLFVPGGFSFADHFGSGKLLAYKLREAGVFDHALELGINILGHCNGFQVLTEAGFFGKGVHLNSNQNLNHQPIGFVNRWVECTGAGKLGEEKYFLPVRHGEGRLTRENLKWDNGVEPLLFYSDDVFKNGSVDQVAGLRAQRGRSLVIGMMPHPEISIRPIDSPDAMGPESAALFRSKLDLKTGDGVRLMNQIFKEGF